MLLFFDRTSKSALSWHWVIICRNHHHLWMKCSAIAEEILLGFCSDVNLAKRTLQYTNYTISTSSEKANRNFVFLNWDLQSTCTEYSTCIRVKRERWKVDYDDVEWMQFILIILYAILVECWHSISSVIEQNNNYCTLANALGLDHIIIIVCIVFPLPLFVVVIITVF